MMREALIPPPQHWLDPPGMEAQPEPAHPPQLRGQQTTPLASMPSMPFEHIGADLSKKEENDGNFVVRSATTVESHKKYDSIRETIAICT